MQARERLVRWLAVLVPDDVREAWRREWLGELAACPPDVQTGRFVRGAVRHALWLRLDAWRPMRLLRDVRFAGRVLWHQKGHSTAAIATLALGIGAATAVFSVADGTLFRPLPYDDPDRLVAVHSTIRARGMQRWDVPDAEYQVWSGATRHLTGLAGSTWSSVVTATGGDELVDVGVVGVTRNFLTVLGVAPAIGRDFADADFRPDATPVLLLTDQVWRRVFRSDRGIVGADVSINGVPTTIVGVLPASFALPSRRGAVGSLAPSSHAAFNTARLDLIGRLSPGSGAEDVTADLDPLAGSRRSDSGIRDTPIDGVFVEPLADYLLGGEARLIMRLLAGAVAALVLIGCANVANLLLSRGAARRGEFALRSALGAGRRALVRQLLVECSLLSFTGGLIGCLLAWWAVGVVRPLVPAELQQFKPLAIDGRVLLFACASSMACVILSGLLPALHVTRTDVFQALNQTSSRSTPSHQRIRQGIVALEVALALVLLVGGGLMTNAMLRLLSLDDGYDASRVLTIQMELPKTGPRPPRPSPDFVARALSAARTIPGVESAGAIAGGVLNKTMYGTVYHVEGLSRELIRQDAAVGGGPCCVTGRLVSSGTFATLGVSVTRGRALLPEDASATPRVALINERLAQKFPPEINPVGHWLVNERDPADRRQIVGVVGDVRDMSLEWAGPQAIYLPLEERGAAGMTLFLRTAGDPMTLAGTARRVLKADAGPVVIGDVRPLDDLVMASVSDHRLNAWLFGTFAVVGLVLAAIGVFSVVSYAVAHRTREIGLRVALGASPAGVRRLVVRQALLPVTVGLVIGLVAAVLLSRYLASVLYDVQPTDMPTYLIVSGVFLATAVVAAHLPARRAARIDPITALRAE